jgi:hypothetical protein
MDFYGLHRNEVTKEIEGYNEYLNQQMQNMFAYALLGKQGNKENTTTNLHEFQHEDINYERIHINEVIEEHLDPK